MTNAPAADTAGTFESPEFGNLEANLRFLDASGLLTETARILEIGSGRGSLLHILRSRRLDVVGTEISADRIGEAVKKYGQLPVRHVTGTTLPFPDGSIDLVLSFDVFEHIRDTDAHLEEVRRVLAPSGSYLLQTPNKWTNSVFETVRWRSFTRWREDHCSLHSRGELRRRLIAHGFEPTFVDVPVVTPFFKSKVRRYLGRPGVALLAVVNPDRLPGPLRTNFYVQARRRSDGKTGR
jgi:SAM-dependent methyltransferase